MILDSRTVERDLALAADVCVIGSGAGGAVVAKVLAERGRSVVVVEEGPYVTSAQFTQREEQMLPLLYADQGLRTAGDDAVVIVQGRVVGGSTVPSLCVCVRPPRPVLDGWAASCGVPGLAAAALGPAFAAVEAVARVQPLREDDLNPNNRRLKVAAERLGFHAYLAAHNRVECLGCGYCVLGCAYARKADALTVHLPAASRQGATIIPDCRVERIVLRDGRAAGIAGRFVRSGAPATLRVDARTVVLAAGAIGSPALWLRSQLPDRHRLVGRNLRVHPQVVLAAECDEEIASWTGIPQALIIDEFAGRTGDGGFLLQPCSLHPIALAALLPGFGGELRALLAAYPRLMLATVVLNDRTTGHVAEDPGGRPAVSYHLTDEDRSDLLDGMRRLADVFFAAGARRVILPFNDEVALTRRGDYRPLDEQPLRANDPLLLSLQPQGSMRMGADPRHAVVDGSGEAHEVRGLFVADASVCPGSTVVPPQLTVMALAWRTAQRIAAG